MRQSGVLAACVPHEFGAWGSSPLHDYVLGINRLGRGDGATAIAANMHIFQPAFDAAVADRHGSQGGVPPASPRLLRQIGAGQVVMSSSRNRAPISSIRLSRQPRPQTAGGSTGGRTSGRCHPSPSSSTSPACETPRASSAGLSRLCRVRVLASTSGTTGTPGHACLWQS